MGENFLAWGCGRSAEEELMTVAEERDRLLPQLEEARWHRRQAEKELAELRESLASSVQVLNLAPGSMLLSLEQSMNSPMSMCVGGFVFVDACVRV
jgi:hypothetical protein